MNKPLKSPLKNPSKNRIFVDAKLFLSMHSRDDNHRIPAKNFFVESLDNKITMTYEQIGICDNAIWQFPKKFQDIYFPFMDEIQSSHIMRLSYDEKDMRTAQENYYLSMIVAGQYELSVSDRLLLAKVKNTNGSLYTNNSRLLHYRDDETLRKDFYPHVLTPEYVDKEFSFPEELEELYQKSLNLRIN